MFITFEGIDSSGKSTQAKLLCDFFNNNDISAILTREPGGTPIAEKIRSILFDVDDVINDSLTELFLYIAARRDHVIKNIEPALQKNKVVICDRFLHSTIAYQSYGFGIEQKKINQLHKMVIPKNCFPDFTFILDIEMEAFKERQPMLHLPFIGKTMHTEIYGKRYENRMPIDFFVSVRKGFIELSKQKNCYLIDANRDIKSIHQDIIKKIRIT